MRRIVVAVTAGAMGLFFVDRNLLLQSTPHADDREERVDENGLFRTRIAVERPGAAVKVVAVDKQGKRDDIEFRLALAESASQPATKVRPTLNLGTYHALIIGNKGYAHWPSLKTSEADALKTAELLKTKYGFKTKVLLNAKRFDILQALNDLRNQIS